MKPTILSEYADPATVTCDRCNAAPANPCVNDDGTIRQHPHTARAHRPVLYACRICDGPFAVSSATGAWVHVGKIDATHSAAPFDDQRQWTP